MSKPLIFVSVDRVESLSPQQQGVIRSIFPRIKFFVDEWDRLSIMDGPREWTPDTPCNGLAIIRWYPKGETTTFSLAGPSSGVPVLVLRLPNRSFGELIVNGTGQIQFETLSDDGPISVATAIQQFFSRRVVWSASGPGQISQSVQLV